MRNQRRSHFSLVFSTVDDILLYRELFAEPLQPLSGAEHLDENDQRGGESKAIINALVLAESHVLTEGLLTSFRLEKLCCVMMLHELLKCAACKCSL